MNSMQRSMTAQIPSHVALPTCGHAFAATLRADRLGLAGTGTSVVVRERMTTSVDAWTKGDIKGGLGLASAYVPGTRAWSPPTS